MPMVATGQVRGRQKIDRYMICRAEREATFLAIDSKFAVWILREATFILSRMKTTISIPDRLFGAAERLAKRLGMSRSEFYSKAVANYVGENRSLDVRERLDAVYGRAPESSQLEAGIKRIQSRSIPTEKW